MTDTNLTIDHFISRFMLQPPEPAALLCSGRQAAVLVPVINRPRPSLLLAQRATTLRKPPGQVAFPGGMKDRDDGSLIATALRETHEEVAIYPDTVTYAGCAACRDQQQRFSGHTRGRYFATGPAMAGQR
ncbi:NUDIX hydrolase [Erwinia tracheiphila PSU-1]|nr:NUDIX hydrolase [Erwinia tracheiphila PSU-1]